MKSNVLSIINVMSSACLLVLACQGTAAAQSGGFLSSAQAHISNLSYRLVDLDPDDGIAPGVVFGQNPGSWIPPDITGHFSYGPVNAEADGYEIRGNAPFRILETNPLYTDRSIGYEGGQIKAIYAENNFGFEQMQIKEQGLSKGAPRWVSPSEGLLETGFQASFFMWTDYQLTPNTALIIEGNLVQNVQIDALALTNDPALLDALTGVRAHSEITFSVDNFSSTVDTDYVVDDLGELTTTTTFGASASKFWSIERRNTSSARQWNSLYFNFAGKTTAVGVVPEPSTWALMLSGLALAGLSARRRQAA